MSRARRWDERRARLLDRAHARIAGRARLSPAFKAPDDPLGSGRFAEGRRLLSGAFRLAGAEVSAPGDSIWAPPLAPPAEEERQSCRWLDDLAAVGDIAARARAQEWVGDWITRYGHGAGPGWRADLVGRRVMHWIGQAHFLLRGIAPEAGARITRSAARQVLFLARRWRGAPAGLPRIEALCGLIEGALALGGMERHLDPALAALSGHLAALIDREGAIPSRNPEELCAILMLVNRVMRRAGAAGHALPAALDEARQRMAPTLRALRHADGGLARFHGGGRGADGMLDSALADSGCRSRREGLAMGFARLAAGRSSVIMDAAPPPVGAPNAHAATLAFELTSGRRPVIVNCGNGGIFGPDWARAGRATASQSVLGIDGFSSARFGSDGDERLSEAPDTVPGEAALTATSHRMGAAHNGWQRTHGLMYARTLDLTLDGRALTGEELLIALRDQDRARFDRALSVTPGGIAFSVRFHLHPEAEAMLDLGGSAVSIALKSGEVWVFRQDGAENMALAPSVWLEAGRAAPRATQQVVLSGRAMAYATRVRWSLAKAQDTPNALRDLGPDSAGEE
ncbi:MAG: heparinase II/III family protein [Rubellimicrobium sp.]|nr:heparinase II/III family protein [Rubellimicrobium sp.]